MKKLWAKGIPLDALIESFTVGDDPLLDKQLIPYDCWGSMAHAAMLHQIGVLSLDELKQLFKGLQNILEKADVGTFVITQQEEDVHTAIENELTKHFGSVGKKLHTSRSRNDQVLVDIRLYSKQQLRTVLEISCQLVATLIAYAKQYQAVAIPGRTHMQKAMPSSWGLWAGAMAETLLDSMHTLLNAYELNDQNPLGSAASYGSALQLDREYTSQLLGFSKTQNNVLYANNSRGKIEAATVHVLSQVMGDLSKLAADLMFFSLPEVDYLSLPAELCPGSSLMPQKQNPCPLELVRAKAATVHSHLGLLLHLSCGLPSGYHRDFQESKRPLMHSFDITIGALMVTHRIVSSLKVNTDACAAACTPEIFATDKVLTLTLEGVPFRDAYQEVSKGLDQLKPVDATENILSKTHTGATGNLGLEKQLHQLSQYQNWHSKESSKWELTLEKLHTITGDLP